ncbi:MAG: 4-hydroxy-3-methylbut-2-enyl diphosphate reductase [Clostridiaceae bacterium]|nr:4-hydroxy-3-methylbut-2-enyl diphosphate reductase [Clostridiaceae bacterium]
MNQSSIKKSDLKVIDIKPRGYCKGVIRSLKVLKTIRVQYPEETISVLGKIVHNKYISKAMDLYKIKTIDYPGLTREELLSYVDHGIIILSAHGSSERVKQLAYAKGLKVIDAACSDVISTHDLIKENLEKNNQVIFIGKNNHPETEAIITNFPKINLITNVKDIDNLNLDQNDQIVISNQTTLSILDMRSLIEAIIKKYPQAQVVDEVCGATRVRQEAVIKHSSLDVLIVVGDPHSNNTSMLAKIGLANGIKNVQRIETVHDLELAELQKGDVVGVTSGASTPPYLTNMISDYLKKLDLDNPAPRPPIEISKILDF